jgi:hypothetical protein
VASSFDDLPQNLTKGTSAIPQAFKEAPEIPWHEDSREPPAVLRTMMVLERSKASPIPRPIDGFEGETMAAVELPEDPPLP